MILVLKSFKTPCLFIFIKFPAIYVMQICKIHLFIYGTIIFVLGN